MKIKTSFALVVTLALFTSGYAQALDKAKLDQFFDRLAEKNKAMGSLTIAKDGKVLYTRAIGYSRINGTEKKPATLATRYRVGSITKMFTAAMIFQLVEEGRIRLTDTLDRFFTQIPNADRITIAQLLAHRSGIHDVSEDRDFRIRRPDGLTKDELLALIASSKPDFEPGAKYAYSNTGFQLLGLLVEKLTGKPYQDALKERITAKLGLKDTYPANATIDVNKNESFSYRYLGDWKQVPETHSSLLFGSGALISTPTDMSRFIQSLFDLKVVSQASLNQMMQNKMGMETFTFGGKTLYGHTGGIDNFGSWLAYLPEEKLAVAYASNAKVYPVANIVSGVFDICWNKPFQIPAFEPLAVSPEVLDKYIGVYASPGVPVKYTVTRDGATLYVQPSGQSAVPLEAAAPDKFKIDPAGIVMEFDAAKNQMIVKRNGRERVFTKET
jgi:CubicO group peptidase (beta-lactamase class C family)